MKTERGVLAFVAVVAAGVALVALGLALLGFDAHHRHIPGHVVYGSLVTAPAVVQLVYVIPALQRASRQGRAGAARGLEAGALCVAALNMAGWVLAFIIPAMDN